MSEEEFNESLDLFRENNLTKYGIDELYGEIVDREIERKRLKSQLQQKENIIKEVRKYTKSHFKEMVADEEAQKLLEILDKENK